MAPTKSSVSAHLPPQHSMAGLGYLIKSRPVNKAGIMYRSVSSGVWLTGRFSQVGWPH